MTKEERMKIWQFCVVLKDVLIGDNCNIYANKLIKNDSLIKNNTIINCGVKTWNRLRLSDNLLIGPNLTFTNYEYQSSKKYPKSYPETNVEVSVSNAVNSTTITNIQRGRIQ